MRLESNDRRHSRRHRVCFPIRLSSDRKQGRIGMCRNGSSTGILLGTPSRFKIGDVLMMKFRVSSSAPERKIAGKVVRLGNEAPNRDHWCHRLVAVRFEEPLPELGRVFADLEPRQAHLFGG